MIPNVNFTYDIYLMKGVSSEIGFVRQKPLDTYENKK